MISVVLATHNEEKNLEKCLKAVEDFADEIIIADGESTDNTCSIAKKFNAKIIETTNKKNFHINKQIAMDKAKGKLVLQLDADEIVDDELKDFISNKAKEYKDFSKKEFEKVPVAWYLKRKNFFLGRFLSKGGQYPDPVIRLYVNGYAYLPQKTVHEQMSVKGITATAQGHILHYSNPHFSDYLRKFNTYTTFTAHLLKKDSIKLSFLLACNYLCLKPSTTFFSLYVRHKGFLDGFPGFIFALMSALHYPVAYLKLWEMYER